MASSIEQHDREIHENAEAWARKPDLQKVYRRFYEEIARRLDRQLEGLTVELGSGMGNVKETIPHCITTDLFHNPWLDRVENAYALTFPDASVSNLILFDVFHHLQHPGTALKEFARVVVKGGRVLLFEPAMGFLGKFVYQTFHHEPLGLDKPIQLFAPGHFDPSAQSYYAAQGNCWRLFRGEKVPPEISGWEFLELTFYPALAYLATGGFSGPQLCPGALFPLINAVDKLLAPWPALSATRMLVVLKKRSAG